MQLSPAPLQQGVVGHLMRQRVLEDVLPGRIASCFVEELGGTEPVGGAIQRLRLHVGDGGQKLIWHPPAYHGSALQDALLVGQ